MIWESIYWKHDLVKLADHLQQRARKGSWGERALANFEKRMFIAFYSIRKLIEAKKLSDLVVNLEVPLTTYQPRGKPITLINCHRIDELYDLESPSRKNNMGLKPLCDQIIHSYIFFPLTNDDGRRLLAILFCSDRHRNKTLYELSLRDAIRVFRMVGENYPKETFSIFDDRFGDYVVHNI